MKKILLTICISLCTAIAFAQPATFGFKGGLNFTEFTLKDANSNLSITSGNWTSFNFGVFADLKIPTSKFSVQPSLLYTGKGGHLAENGNGASVTIDEKLYYLELPVDLVYHSPVAAGDFYFGAGPYLAFGVSGKLTANLDDGSGNTTNAIEPVKFGNGPNDDITPTQFGGNLLAGFKFKNGFLINANYDFGLTNDIPGATNSGGKNKSNVFSISIGFALK